MNVATGPAIAQAAPLRFERRHAWQIAALLFVSLSLHWVSKALSAWIDPALTLAALMLFDATVIAALARSSGSRRTAAVLAALLLLVYVSRQHEFVTLPSVALNLAGALVFGLTLQRGRTPLIVAIVTHALGAAAVDADFARYLRRLNAAWCLFFVLMTLACAALALLAPFAWWSLFANVLSWPLIGLMFVIEYAVRRAFFPHLPAHTPLQTIVSALSYPVAKMRASLAASSSGA